MKTDKILLANPIVELSVQHPSSIYGLGRNSKVDYIKLRDLLCHIVNS